MSITSQQNWRKKNEEDLYELIWSDFQDKQNAKEYLWYDAFCVR